MCSTTEVRNTSGVFSTQGGTMSTPEDIMSTLGMFSTPGFPYKLNCFPNDLPPLCTEHPPVYCTDIAQGDFDFERRTRQGDIYILLSSFF